ncbi:MAG: DUF6338 family protein [Terracidiphilus sp.]|jgi:hypothetical protein
MPVTLLALQVFLILLPGFSAAYVVQALATRRSQTDFERLIEALVFSFVIYVCYVPLNGGRLPFHIQDDPAGKGNDTVLWEPAQLAWLAGVTIAFTLFAVAYFRFDGNRLFRFLRLTERTTCNSIWNDIFEREAIDNQPVQVELADGRSVLGILLYYSDTSDEGSVYLKDASWVDAEGQTIPIPGPGILLTKSCDIRSVSLLNPVTDLPVEAA